MLAKLNDAEKKCIDLTVALWNLYSQLDDANDAHELMVEIHHIQHRIMARATRRAHPELFR